MDTDPIQRLFLSLPLLLPLDFSFHPTEVELLYYLWGKVFSVPVDLDKIIPELDIYKHEPWDLPAMFSPRPSLPSSHTNSTWYFFTPRDRRDSKYHKRSRVYRTAQAGYWKSTGNDCTIRDDNQNLGTKKTLVFHLGRHPSGTRTEWIMHEYSIHKDQCKDAPHLKDLFVLCRVTKRGADRSEQLHVPNQLGADQIPVGSTPSVPKPEPLYYSPGEGSEDEDTYLLHEEIQSILSIHDHEKTQNLSFLEDESACTSSAVETNLVGYTSSAPKPEPWYCSPGEGSGNTK